MIQAIIIDDEQHCIDRLNKLLKQDPDIQVITTVNTMAEAIDKINLLKPGLIFLDVQIGHETGFDLLEKVSYRNFEIIFTTAYESYALQAIKCSAIDYLLKPIDAFFREHMKNIDAFRMEEGKLVLLTDETPMMSFHKIDQQ